MFELSNALLIAATALGCGTERAPEPASEPERAESTASSDEGEESSDPESNEETAETPLAPASADELPGGERPIFTTIHRCEPDTECVLQIARVDGHAFVELGHGHREPPIVQVDASLAQGALRLFGHDGRAATVLTVSPAEAVQVELRGLARHALQPGAYHLGLEGDDARDVVLRIAPAGG